MRAIETCPQFSAWFTRGGNTYFRKELLARRHRADLDPIMMIASKNRVSKCLESPRNANVEGKEQRILTRREIELAVEEVLDNAGTEQSLLGILFKHVNAAKSDVSDRLLDKLIMERSLGKKATPAVAYVAANRQKPKKSRKDQDELQPAPMFQASNRSELSNIRKQAKKPGGPGNNIGIPKSELVWCDVCGGHVKGTGTGFL